MYKISTFVFILLFMAIQHGYSQKVKFGKVSKEELEEIFYPLDSSANAAFLFKKRRTYYRYDQNDGFQLITTIHERIKLYNKEGFDWATKQIRLYNRGSDEKVSIKAYTFNLNEGKVEKIKLKGSEVFKEQINKYWYRKKFTMPNVKAGSIIEWEYTITSPYVGKIDDVVFQYSIPVKQVESKIEIPEYFMFKNVTQGFYPINFSQTTNTGKITFVNKERTSGSFGDIAKTKFSTSSVDYKTNITLGMAKNVPAIKNEPYVNNINNYRTILKYEHTATQFPNSPIKYYNTTWKDVTKTIYDSPSFGGQLDKASHFKEELNSLVNKTAPAPEKIAKIFQFVKSKIKWDGYFGKYTDKGVRKAYKDGVGNVAEVNLTLVAMLRDAGLAANPILVSTRSHGIPMFPTTDGFNYVIAGVEIQNAIILLDATEPYSIPNVLPARDLNWSGRVVRENGSSAAINLFPKRYARENNYINISLDAEGFVENGLKRSSYDNLNALNFRNKYNKVSKEDLAGKLEKKYNIEISDLKIQNELQLGKPVVEMVKFDSEDIADVISNKMFIDPLLFLTQHENPFKLEERKFPIDYATPWEDKTSINIVIPEGYTVESLPEKIAIGLPDNLGTFRFMASIKGNKIQVLSSIKINEPIIAPQYYLSLKEFYEKVIKKQKEKIILVKN